MFQPFEKFVYRLPAFSVDRLMEIFDMEGKFLELLAGERIRETVYVGSPDLYKELQKLINGEIKEEDKKRKIETSLVKYLSRMSTRCTPFGLFATCSVGKIIRSILFFMVSINHRFKSCCHIIYFRCDTVEPLFSAKVKVYSKK